MYYICMYVCNIYIYILCIYMYLNIYMHNMHNIYAYINIYVYAVHRRTKLKKIKKISLVPIGVTNRV